MCWRQVRIYTVPHTPIEVHSQLYKLQIPVRKKWRNHTTYIIALKPLEKPACCLILISHSFGERGWTHELIAICNNIRLLFVTCCILQYVLEHISFN